MDYQKWLDQVPVEIREDKVWRLEVYRLGLFAADIGWYDVTALSRDRRTRGLSDQLYRALGSISANTGEGFSRGTGKDRARFYEYALGSARESRGWYYKGRHILKPEVVQHRIGLLTHVIKLLLTMIPDQRGTEIREEQMNYIADGPQALLTEIPFLEDKA
ncbi:MAG: four helix bundle protein [Lentisphaeria bacterium]|nr:four helix bundle protein [Lentisphaeria bacterium]